jgi:hypothetical protein
VLPHFRYIGCFGFKPSLPQLVSHVASREVSQEAAAVATQ